MIIKRKMDEKGLNEKQRDAFECLKIYMNEVEKYNAHKKSKVQDNKENKEENKEEKTDEREVPYFLLNGPGGSGKTYLITKFLKEVKNIKNKVLAPTHKACGVLSKVLIENKIINPVNTIAKYLGYEEDYDEEGKMKPKYNYPDTNYDLLIVDECSMINKDQMILLKTIKVPIIFIGDYCQINPVGEILSEVFNMKFTFKIDLTTNERLKKNDPQLSNILTYFRENVYKGYVQKKSIENDYRIRSKEEFDKQLIESFEDPLKETIFITYTNTQVALYNKKIRSHLYSTETLKEYELGERMVFTDYMYIDKKNKYYTSDRVIIDSVRKDYFSIRNPVCICKNDDKKNEEEIPFIKPYNGEVDEKIKSCTKCHTVSSIKEYKTIEMWEIKFENQEHKFYKPVDKKEMYSIIYKYRDRAKQIKSTSVWKDYYNKLKILDTPIDYSYAMTVHKAQGSGYDNVFVDMENIGWCKQEKEKLRLLYTAVSRTKSKLLFYKP